LTPFKGGVLALISDARGAQFILSPGVRATRLAFEISNLKFQIPEGRQALRGLLMAGAPSLKLFKGGVLAWATQFILSLGVRATRHC
jgi:hypothetical protein